MFGFKNTFQDAANGCASWLEALLELCNVFDATHGVLFSTDTSGVAKLVTHAGFPTRELPFVPTMLRVNPSVGIVAGSAADSPLTAHKARQLDLGSWVQVASEFGVVILFRPTGGDDFDEMDMVALTSVARLMDDSGRPKVRRSRVALASVVLLGLFGSQDALAMPADSVTLTLKGEVEAACAITPGSAGTRIDLDEISSNLPSATGELAFTLNCNAPFSYALESDNGALVNGGGRVADGSDTIETTLPYTVRFQADLEDGDTDTIDQTCTSGSIDVDLPDGSSDQCVFADSGTAVAIGEPASLSVSVDSTGRVLLGGTYTDNLKLTVSVRP